MSQWKRRNGFPLRRCRAAIRDTFVSNLSGRSSCKVADIVVCLFVCNQIRSSATVFREIPKVSNFMKIRPVGAALIHADGHDGTTELTGDFL